MKDALPKLSVVIPNFNGATARDGLVYLQMVRGTLAEQELRDFEVIVADDASTDDSLGWLRENWPEARVVAQESNSGFASTANLGMAAARGEYIALINSDIELTPDWLASLAAALDASPRAGFATAKILAHDDRALIEQAGQDWYTCGRFGPRGIGERDTGQFDQARPALIGTAAAVMYRRAAVEAAGALDEDYYLYCEDSDLCLRMTLAGSPGVYVPGPAVFHVRGKTTGRGSDLVQFHVLRNGLLTLIKDMPGSILVRSLPKIALYELYQFKAARDGRYGRVFLRAYGSFLRMLPATLRKRRRIQSARSLRPREFKELLVTEYPVPSLPVSAWRRLSGRAG